MTSPIIIPNDAMVSVPVPPLYIGREVEVTCALVNGAGKTAIREQQILEPDDDFYRAISMDEFKERARVVVEDAYKRYTNERNNITGSTRIS
jgi:hypothetical protein